MAKNLTASLMGIKQMQGLHMVVWYHCCDRRTPSDYTLSPNPFYLVGSKNENTTVVLQTAKLPRRNK